MARLLDSQLQAIRANPIKDELDSFRDTFKSTYSHVSDGGSPSSFRRLVADSSGKRLVLKLIAILLNLPAASALPSENGAGPLSGDLFNLGSQVTSNVFDIRHASELVDLVVARAEDTKIWTAILHLIARTQLIHRPTTPPQSSASFAASFQQTPWSFNTGSFADTSDLRRDVDPILKGELEGNLIIDHPEFFNTFFRGVPQLDEMAAAVFEMCKEAQPPLYREGIGWVEWPEDCLESRVLHWLRQHVDQFLRFANERSFQPPTCRRCFATPNKPIPGSVSKRKLDVGIICDRRNETPVLRAAPRNTSDDAPCDWTNVLVPGELKSNPREDNHSSTWFDLSRYAREIFAAQDTRRSVTGFTLCGHIMRLWEFDRLGGIASQSFNIHEEGLMFISAVLGFLWMTEKELGYDPTIYENTKSRYIAIMRNGKPEQYHLDEVMKRQRCVAGRATTCWRVYRDGDKSGPSYAVKDSWEDEERPEEGLLLKRVTEAGVRNVAEYHYHETVRDGNAIVDIRNNVRKGLRDEGGKYPFRRGYPNSQSLADSSKPEAPVAERLMSGGRGRSRSRSITRKRSSSSRPTSMPPPKRSCSDSPVKEDRMQLRRNRVHRRLIMSRVGKSIYDASSPAAIITGILGGVKGHESLLERKVLHRDISVGNIMLEESENDGFLIDLDLAIEIDRKEASGAPSKTGTKVFMAIGALYGENHNFIHDLESFFWVLFWLCIHCTGPGGKRRRTKFQAWNYKDTEELAREKEGLISRERVFVKTLEESVTDFCRPLVPLVTLLRKEVFPNGKICEREDRGLYNRVKSILKKARKDQSILATI